MPKKKEHSDVVRIAKGLLDAVKEFRETKEAEHLGLFTNAQVINEAVREFLRRMKILP